MTYIYIFYHPTIRPAPFDLWRISYVVMHYHKLLMYNYRYKIVAKCSHAVYISRIIFVLIMFYFIKQDLRFRENDIEKT
ncbi:hypothetical protein D3C85_455680 [compost metagenome]